MGNYVDSRNRKNSFRIGLERAKKIYEFTYQIIKEAGEDVLGVIEKFCLRCMKIYGKFIETLRKNVQLLKIC